MLSLLGQAWRGSRCEVGEMVGFEVQEGVYGAGVLCLERAYHTPDGIACFMQNS